MKEGSKMGELCVWRSVHQREQGGGEMAERPKAAKRDFGVPIGRQSAAASVTSNWRPDAFDGLSKIWDERDRRPRPRRLRGGQIVQV
jgi:hypothetical protein